MLLQSLRANVLDANLELAGSALLSYEKAFPEEKRELVRIITSNRVASGKNVELKPSIPFREIADRFIYAGSAPGRDIPRTLDRMLERLIELNRHGSLPCLDSDISLSA